MKGKINFDCYKSSGGADKISAINYTGLELNKYDKIVISDGETSPSDDTALSLANTYANRFTVDVAWPKKKCNL